MRSTFAAFPTLISGNLTGRGTLGSHSSLPCARSPSATEWDNPDKIQIATAGSVANDALFAISPNPHAEDAQETAWRVLGSVM